MAEHRQRFHNKGRPFVSAGAFSRLYEDTHRLVFRYVYGLLGGPRELVEDISAEVYFRAWKARRSFKGEEKAGAGWLLKIARNLVIDRARKEKSRGIPYNIEDLLLPDPGLSPEEQALFNEQAGGIWQGMQAITAERREMLVLRYMLGWKVKEIAGHLGQLENTVSQNLRRSLKKLKTEIEGQ